MKITYQRRKKMNKRLLSMFLVFTIIFSSMFVLAGCKKKETETKVDSRLEELEKMCNIKIYEHEPSGTKLPDSGEKEYKMYFIDYSKSKLYICTVKKDVPTQKVIELLDVKEINVTSDAMKELEEFIEDEIDRPRVAGGTIYSIVKDGKNVNDISNTSEFEKYIRYTTMKKVNFTEAELKEKADVIITPIDKSGGDCIQYTNYYISYSESKLYVYEYFKIVPLTTQEEAEKNPHEPEITVSEYDINEDQMARMKAFVEKENKREKGSKYYIIVNGVENIVQDTPTFDKLVKEIFESQKI
jgi:hypothetical protein